MQIFIIASLFFAGVFAAPMDKPLMHKPLMLKLVMDKPLMEKPLMNKPLMHKLVMDKPLMEKPLMDKPLMHKLVMDKPLMEKPLMHKLVMDKPLMEKPMMDKPPMDVAQIDLVQDTLGNYRLVYHDKNITRSEQGFDDGHVVGSYDYIDYDGVKHTIKFLASKDGYTAEGDDIPVPVAEPVEVVMARAHHMATMEKQRAYMPKLDLEEMMPVDPKEVIARLVMPEIRTLPKDFVPEEPEDILMAKKELLEAYAKVLEVMIAEYSKL